MGIAEQILEELQGIRAALAGGAPATDKPAGKPSAKKTAPKGPTLVEVQEKVKALAEKGGEPVKTKLKAAISDLGGKRVGDFEGDADKLAKLDTALDAIAAELDAPEEESDEDLL